MKLLGASFIITCNDDIGILRNGGVLIDNGKILAVGDFNELKQQCRQCDFLFYKNHIILPALINSHIHFEFSKNISSFMYGRFDLWLNSVMQNRGAILKDNLKAIQKAIMEQKKSGVGTVCAISSYDLDLDCLLNSNLRVIFCHEVIGADEKDFENQVINISNRLEHSMALKTNLFQSALALHAPYSVHTKLAQYIIELASKYKLLISTHFLESKHELEWLQSKSGYFKEFYDKYLKLEDVQSFNQDEFIDLFHDVQAIFTHCLYADSSVKEEILKRGSIISCPRSNLLLNGKMGDNNIIATDGKSSNNDVDLLQEMRYVLFATLSAKETEQDESKSSTEARDIESISKHILYAVTCNPAKALGLNNGVLQEGKDADIAIFEIECEHLEQVITSFVLNAKGAISLLVNGVDIISYGNNENNTIH
ncbi:metal-dependent hydrolase [Helicobacter muridarum]|uniref:Amidohydrolase n=1 Tax=Helicobacter muridarum TaxID=216 RepID=A0A377PRG7_9HELI|nr:aminofutalosine deaminase family hydrolase [Helicobacter muridarum]TLD99009.1 metal-dependent hydrolase [Helicobacter muridarum]STQ85426.1 amidohydrolase [Helicobacter muridarum]